ncbi:MAG: protein of unknown function DUF3007 [Siphoviridae sp. ctCJE6]|nr:MAG: protein of unknown function DUF3007 [Siphoviridae sp. ctCJE6]
MSTPEERNIAEQILIHRRMRERFNVRERLERLSDEELQKIVNEYDDNPTRPLQDGGKDKGG